MSPESRPKSESSPEFTHLDEKGRVRMVDVGDKDVTTRRAKARGTVLMAEETLGMIISQDLKKGDALSAARIAGIMAAKRASDIIPLCHPLALSHVNVTVDPKPGQGRLEIEAEVRCEGRTGVEMEALTAVAGAALTIYDMVKAVDRDVILTDIKLMEKSGGQSGTWNRV